MIVDFTDLKAQTRDVLARYDHKNWNDFLDVPVRSRTSASSWPASSASASPFPMLIRVWEGNGKWAEM